MKIVVCIKQVADSATKIIISDSGKWIDDSDVKYILNPYDEFAVEEAVKMKESHEAEVIILSMGPSRAGSAIRNALAMGGNSGVHLKTDGVVMGLSVAKALADELKNLAPDIIFFGKQAIDDDNMQIGPMVAELLDMPLLNVVTKLEINGDSGTAEREIEGGKEIIEFSLPAIVTTQKGLNEPRYPSLKGIMMAKKKPVEEKDANIPESGISITNMEYPPERKEHIILTDGAGSVPELVRLLKDEAKVL